MKRGNLRSLVQKCFGHGLLLLQGPALSCRTCGSTNQLRTGRRGRKAGAMRRALAEGFAEISFAPRNEKKPERSIDIY